MSDKLAWHCYTHLETKGEKQNTNQEMHAYTYNYRKYKETLRQRERERERNADQDTYLYTRQYSRTLRDVFREKEREKYGPRHVPLQVTLIIAEHWEMYSETRERETRIKRRGIYTYNESQNSRTLLQIYREKEKNKHDQKTYMHIQSVTIYPDNGMDIQSQRERS